MAGAWIKQAARYARRQAPATNRPNTTNKTETPIGNKTKMTLCDMKYFQYEIALTRSEMKFAVYARSALLFYSPKGEFYAVGQK